MSSYDFVVVGGGILGLATAHELLGRHRGSSVAVLEKEDEIATHQTSRNSGVVHAGIYYQPGSLKARLTREGRVELERFAVERGIPYERVGKLVIALDEAELPRLSELGRRANANGVEGLMELDAAGIRRIEPHAAGVRALHSPSTAITDFGLVARALADEIQDRDGTILVGREVISIEERANEVVVRTSEGEISAQRLVTCAGLQSDRVAGMTGHDGARIIPFRGDYLRLKSQARGLVNGNLYPVPDPRFPFLGVHATPRIGGEVLLGPNAVLALAREGYDKSNKIRWADMRATFGFPGFWRLASRHAVAGALELWRDKITSAYVAEARRYLPDLRLEDVEEGPCGIRAQAVTRGGSLVDDFVIDASPRVVHVRNAPSPAATASLAIGRTIADRIAGAVA